MIRRLGIILGLLLVVHGSERTLPGTAPRPLLQAPPTVRIGLNPSAESITVRSAQPFLIQQNRTRSAKFTTVLVMTPGSKPTNKQDLQYSMLVELDGGKVLVLPMTSKVRLEPGTARLQIDNRTYRGVIDVFGNSHNTFTVVNELPMEDYLLGVVPNELSARTFPQLEALKAQAVAARTYIVRNMGQFQREGYDICATDVCQVYLGADTEDPLSSQAVSETRGVIATYAGEPINALYSSTCGGRTENAENIFEEKLPYLISVICEYKHPEAKPFTSSRAMDDWKDAVLAIAGVSNFTEARRFLGLPGRGEPPTMQLEPLAKYLRENFYPNAALNSDLEFLMEQGILSASANSAKDILFRLIEKKGAFEWQEGVLVSWDGQTATLITNGAPTEFNIRSDAPIFQRIGDDRIPMKEGMWIGGELMEFRATNHVIEMLAYRKNFVNATADRYSRLAMWQVHRTRQELNTALRSLNVGEIRGLRVLERGPSERPLTTEIVGSSGRRSIRALRLRTLLGLRDSLIYFDEERNAKGDLIGMTFYGRGWGHGVGMCQVGAYGMALEGATYDQILKKYYTGIELKKLS